MSINAGEIYEYQSCKNDMKNLLIDVKNLLDDYIDNFDEEALSNYFQTPVNLISKLVEISRLEIDMCHLSREED